MIFQNVFLKFGTSLQCFSGNPRLMVSMCIYAVYFNTNPIEGNGLRKAVEKLKSNVYWIDNSKNDQQYLEHVPNACVEAV